VKDIAMAYDARDRRLLLEVTHLIKQDPKDLELAERSVGQEIYFKLQERGDIESDRRTSEMGERASAAMDHASKRNKAWRWVKMGAGAAAGGVVIGKYSVY
jgi:hypothetical protein